MGSPEKLSRLFSSKIVRGGNVIAKAEFKDQQTSLWLREFGLNGTTHVGVWLRPRLTIGCNEASVPQGRQLYSHPVIHEETGEWHGCAREYLKNIKNGEWNMNESTSKAVVQSSQAVAATVNVWSKVRCKWIFSV